MGTLVAFPTQKVLQMFAYTTYVDLNKLNVDFAKQLGDAYPILIAVHVNRSL